MNTSNKLLLGLLLTVLLFTTVMLGTAKYYMVEGRAEQEVVTPPTPPEVPEAPTPAVE